MSPSSKFILWVLSWPHVTADSRSLGPISSTTTQYSTFNNFSRTHLKQLAKNVTKTRDKNSRFRRKDVVNDENMGGRVQHGVTADLRLHQEHLVAVVGIIPVDLVCWKHILKFSKGLHRGHVTQPVARQTALYAYRHQHHCKGRVVNKHIEETCTKSFSSTRSRKVLNIKWRSWVGGLWATDSPFKAKFWN